MPGAGGAGHASHDSDTQPASPAGLERKDRDGMARQTRTASTQPGTGTGASDLADAIPVDRLEEYFVAHIAAAAIASQGRQPQQRWVCHWSLSLARRLALEVRARRAPGGLWATPRRTLL